MERRLAAKLAADVVGYSRLMGADEAGTLARLEGLKDEVLTPLIAEHRGRVVKLLGDGSPAEHFRTDQGSGGSRATSLDREWTRRQAGRTDCFSFVSDGDSINWINGFGQFHSAMKRLD